MGKPTDPDDPGGADLGGMRRPLTASRGIATVVPFHPSTSPEARERELLAAWRESHWTLQERLQALARATGDQEIDALYQRARQSDTRLTELYQRRAEALARQVRDLLLPGVSASPGRPGSGPFAPPEASRDDVENALLAWFRDMSPEDRRTVATIAERLAADGPDDADR